MGQLYNPKNAMDRIILGIMTESLSVEKRVAEPGSTVSEYFVIIDKEDDSEIKIYFTSDDLAEDLYFAKIQAGLDYDL